jgi:hypothetical protein
MLRALVALMFAVLWGTAMATDSAEGLPYVASDHRIVIQVTPEERHQVLYAMREFLHDLYNIDLALSQKDMRSVATSAEPLSEILDRLPAGLRGRLPEPFLEIANGQREIFQVIERDAKSKAEVSLTLSQMAEAMTYCSGCHDTFRFQPNLLNSPK